MYRQELPRKIIKITDKKKQEPFHLGLLLPLHSKRTLENGHSIMELISFTISSVTSLSLRPKPLGYLSKLLNLADSSIIELTFSFFKIRGKCKLSKLSVEFLHPTTAKSFHLFRFSLEKSLFSSRCFFKPGNFANLLSSGIPLLYLPVKPARQGTPDGKPQPILLVNRSYSRLYSFSHKHVILRLLDNRVNCIQPVGYFMGFFELFGTPFRCSQ